MLVFVFVLMLVFVFVLMFVLVPARAIDHTDIE